MVASAVKHKGEAMTTPDELANRIVTAAQCDSRMNALDFAASLLRQWQRDIELREIDRCAREWATEGHKHDK